MDEGQGITGMNDMKDFIRVSIPVERASRSGASSEGVWVKLVKPLPPQRAIAEVDNIPFSLNSLSCGDKILVEYREGRVVFDSIIERGGHSTFQIFVERKSGDASKMLDTIKAIGCDWEKGKHLDGQHYALDVPPDVNIHDIHEILDKGQREGYWVFQEGYMAHPRRGPSPVM